MSRLIPLSWRGAWSEGKSYGAGQVVTFKGAAFVAVREPGETVPDPWCEDDCRWVLLADARRAGAVEVSDEPIPLSWRGAWSEGKSYGPGQVVTFKGAAFVAVREPGESAPD